MIPHLADKVKKAKKLAKILKKLGYSDKAIKEIISYYMD
jgi:hypothetical protein